MCREYNVLQYSIIPLSLQYISDLPAQQPSATVDTFGVCKCNDMHNMKLQVPDVIVSQELWTTHLNCNLNSDCFNFLQKICAYFYKKIFIRGPSHVFFFAYFRSYFQKISEKNIRKEIRVEISPKIWPWNIRVTTPFTVIRLDTIWRTEYLDRIQYRSCSNSDKIWLHCGKWWSDVDKVCEWK